MVPEFSNIEASFKYCIFLFEKFEELQVKILVDGGCNSNMVSSALEKKYREDLPHKMRSSKRCNLALKKGD